MYREVLKIRRHSQSRNKITKDNHQNYTMKKNYWQWICNISSWECFLLTIIKILWGFWGTESFKMSFISPLLFHKVVFFCSGSKAMGGYETANSCNTISGSTGYNINPMLCLPTVCTYGYTYQADFIFNSNIFLTKLNICSVKIARMFSRQRWIETRKGLSIRIEDKSLVKYIPSFLAGDSSILQLLNALSCKT
jgi:hypothetical protein